MKFKYIFAFLIIFPLFFSSHIEVFAQQGVTHTDDGALQEEGVTHTDDGAISNNQGSEGKEIQLTNPLGKTRDIPTLVQKLLEIVLKIGVPLIALAIIYTGYLFIAAQGKPEKLTVAKQSLVWVVVGAAILLGAYVIAEALFSTINAIRG